jgi:hypothetical protein
MHSGKKEGVVIELNPTLPKWEENYRSLLSQHYQLPPLITIVRWYFDRAMG